jgi:hypothetical protein
MKKTEEEWGADIRARIESGEQISFTGCGMFNTVPRSDQYWTDYFETYFQSLLDEKEIQWNFPSQN